MQRRKDHEEEVGKFLGDGWGMKKTWQKFEQDLKGYNSKIRIAARLPRLV